MNMKIIRSRRNRKKWFQTIALLEFSFYSAFLSTGAPASSTNLEVAYETEASTEAVSEIQTSILETEAQLDEQAEEETEPETVATSGTDELAPVQTTTSVISSQTTTTSVTTTTVATEKETVSETTTTAPIEEETSITVTEPLVTELITVAPVPFCETPIIDDEYLLLHEYEIDLSEYELNLIVAAVQHEVGNDPSYYPGYDFNYIQQCMTRVIINRLYFSQFRVTTIYETLTASGQFMPISSLVTFDDNGNESWIYDPYDETTRANVLYVLTSSDSISRKLICEMSYRSYNPDNIKNVRKQTGEDLVIFYEAISADSRHLIFAEFANA